MGKGYQFEVKYSCCPQNPYLRKTRAAEAVLAQVMLTSLRLIKRNPEMLRGVEKEA